MIPIHVLTVQAVVLSSFFYGCASTMDTGEPPIETPAAIAAVSAPGYLIVDYEESRVVYLDRQGQRLWALEQLYYPTDAKMLTNGNVLIAEQAQGAVREYTTKGEMVWEFSSLQRPRSVVRLDNGNTLIAEPTGQRVREIDPQKRVVWEFSETDVQWANFRPWDAQRLDNGNTLIVDYGGKQAIEVTQQKKVVWSVAGSFTAGERLANGNTLLCQLERKAPENRSSNVNSHRFFAIEVDSQSRTVWKIELRDYPYDVDRLDNGDTLTAEEAGVRIYDESGKLLREVYDQWSYEVTRY